MLGTSVFLILRLARQRSFTRFSWAWLGVFFAVAIMESLSGLITTWINLLKISRADFLFGTVSAMLRDIASSAFFGLLHSVGLLLLILFGVRLARRHGQLALLLPLGYLIPTVVLGTFDLSTGQPYSLFWIIVSVLAYRMLVTLIAPIWIVRSASDHTRRRAGAIVLPVALGILLAAHAGYLSASLAAYGSTYGLVDYYYYFSPDLLILIGIALAIALYKSVTPSQAVTGSEQKAAEMTGG